MRRRNGGQLIVSLAVLSVSLCSGCRGTDTEPGTAEFHVDVRGKRSTLENCSVHADLLDVDPELYFGGRFFSRMRGDFEKAHAAGAVVLESRCEGYEVGRLSLPVSLCPWESEQRKIVQSGGTLIETRQVQLEDDGQFTTVSQGIGVMRHFCEIASAAQSRDGDGLSFHAYSGTCSPSFGTDVELRWTEDEVMHIDRPVICAARRTRNGGRGLALEIASGTMNPGWSVDIDLVLGPTGEPPPRSIECCGESQSPWTMTANLSWQESTNDEGRSHHQFVGGSLSNLQIHDEGSYMLVDIALDTGVDATLHWMIQGFLLIPILDPS